jgi:hypothetical protein
MFLENATPFFFSQDPRKGRRLPKSPAIFTLINQQFRQLFD